MAVERQFVMKMVLFSRAFIQLAFQADQSQLLLPPSDGVAKALQLSHKSLRQNVAH